MLPAEPNLPRTVASWTDGEVLCVIDEWVDVGDVRIYYAEARHEETDCAVFLQGARVGNNDWTRAALGRAAAWLSDPANDTER